MKETRKLLSVMLSLIIVFSALIFSTIPAQALSKISVEDGTYVFYSKLGGDMVMDIDNASAKSGANVQLWKYNGSKAQQFEVKKSGDWYIIKPVCSGLALDVKGGSTESGANVQQYTINNTDSQKWQFYDNGNGYYYIRSKVGSKALDVNGGKKTNGTNIQVYTPSTNNDSQQWKLVKQQNTASKSQSWQYPVKSYTKSQAFNHYSNRMAQKGRPYHSGIDLTSSEKDIYAVADGKVVYKGYSSGNGYHVVLSHTLNGNTVKTLYSHLSSYNSCPDIGKSVSKGKKIGVMGNSGNSSGTHLHFGVFIGSSNDPYGYVSKSGSNKMTHNGITFYNPDYVIKYNKLP